MKQHLIASLLSLLVSTTLAGCLAGCADQRPAAEPTAQEISSADAVSAARRDAANRFRLTEVSAVAVMRAGRYWVVDLRGRDGGGLHYAIATDGSIRERRMIQ